MFVLHLTLQKPGIYLHEIQEELEISLLVEVSLSTPCTFLHKSGFTCQRLRTVALQQDRMPREQFSCEVSVYATVMFVFVDETGSDARNKQRRYGYSIRGKPAKNQTLLVGGERVSAIACMSSAGLLDVQTFQGTATGEIFYNFVQTHLLSHLMVLIHIQWLFGQLLNTPHCRGRTFHPWNWSSFYHRTPLILILLRSYFQKWKPLLNQQKLTWCMSQIYKHYYLLVSPK